jgi:hypothetical protein
MHYARVITNPHVNLKEPYNLNRADGDYVRLSRSPAPSLDADARGRSLRSHADSVRASHLTGAQSLQHPRIHPHSPSSDLLPEDVHLQTSSHSRRTRPHDPVRSVKGFASFVRGVALRKRGGCCQGTREEEWVRSAARAWWSLR